MKLLKKIAEYLLIIGMAAANAVIYAIFVYPNQFAPSGFNGIATIVQYLFDINVGYLSLLFNVPLIIAVFILVDREFALKSMAYVVTFSVLSILTQKPFLDLSAFAYQTETGTSIVMGPMVAGILMGGIIGILLLANASTGGTDLVAALIHKYKPNYGFVWVTFALNSFVALLSFISSNGQMEPVLMCIVYCYLSTAVTVGGGIFGGLAKPMKITFDDGEVIEERLMFSVFGNGQVYGGGYHPVPDARLDDGLMDFCAISDASIFKIAELIGIYKKGEHIGSPIFDGLLTMHRCSSAKIESSEELTVCVDGEIFKSNTIEIKMKPGSLPFRVPAFEK